MAFQDLKAALDKLPDNQNLLAQYDQTWHHDKPMCEQIEVQAVKLAKQGKRTEAQQMLNS